MAKSPLKETGKAGLTHQVRDYLRLAEKIYPIYAVRNQQALGSDRGRPNYEIGLPVNVEEKWGSQLDIVNITDEKTLASAMETIYIELKFPKWRGKLNRYQQFHKDRIERAGGEYHIITSIEELHKIFLFRGYDRVEI
jgi:hypothetical protein